MKIICKNDNDISLFFISPLEMKLSLNCKEIKVNDLKKIRSLITSVSSEATSEIYVSESDKIQIFDIFFMDYYDQNSNEFAKTIIQQQITKISKVLSWPPFKFRINFQVYFLLFYPLKN